MSKSVDENLVTVVDLEEIKSDIIDPSEVTKVTDDAIKNVGKINEAMQFNSLSAVTAFNAISSILKGAQSNEEKKRLIAQEQSTAEDDTTLQVFANMAIGMLGSSKEGVVDENEVPGIEKLSKAFAFLGHQIDDEDGFEKDKRLADMAGAYASLMSDKEIDEPTKKSIETAFNTAFNKTPDIAKIAQIQEGEENKDPKKLEEVKKIPNEDLKDPYTYNGENWERTKYKAIFGAKGAIAIGLLFAPGGIFLAPLFLLATKNFGRNPDDIDKEQKDAKATEFQSKETLEFLNAFEKYLPDPKVAKQNEGDEQGLKEDLELAKKKPIDETTVVGKEAEEFTKNANDSLEGTKGTLKANEEALKRVEEINSTAVSKVDKDTKAALAKIVGDLRGTNLEERSKDETTVHGVNRPRVGPEGVERA